MREDREGREDEPTRNIPHSLTDTKGEERGGGEEVGLYKLEQRGWGCGEIGLGIVFPYSLYGLRLAGRSWPEI